MDACAQKRLIDDGEIDPRDLLRATCERIEALNPHINAVIHRVDPDTIESASGGAFTGVPLLLKDAVLRVAGMPLHEGMRFLAERNWTETEDSFLARRFRDAGFAFVGKTNTPELALAPTTEPVSYGPTRNPWDPRRSSGGSSGGAAAAVAAGMVAIAHANDWAGSIRIPAAACGVVGLKPSRGRVSAGPAHVEIAGGRGVEHVVTRSVRDSAAALDAIAGAELGDSLAAGGIDGRFVDHLEPRRSLSIGIYTARDVGGVPIHDSHTRAVADIGRLLESAGHRVEEDWPTAFRSGMEGNFARVYGAHAASMLDSWAARLGASITESDVEPETWAWAELGRSTGAARYLADKQWLSRWGSEIGRWWSSHDLLVAPTLVEPIPMLGELASDPSDPWRVIAAQGRYGLLTAPWNVTGQPAMSLPTHEDDGLPVGVQLIGGAGREDLLFEVAAEIERALPWAGRHPAIGDGA